MARQLDATSEVLTEFGCAQGWSLTDAGERLRSIFHEADLLTVVVLHDGVFDGLDSARLAGLVSVLTYEQRSPQPSAAPRYPDEECRDRAAHIFEVAAQISDAERRHRLALTRAPDATFLETAHAWASGANYDELWRHDLTTSDAPTGGDFVRHMRRLIDLNDRIAVVAPNPGTRKAAASARAMLDRGVVATAARVLDEPSPSASTARFAQNWNTQPGSIRVRTLR